MLAHSPLAGRAAALLEDEVNTHYQAREKLGPQSSLNGSTGVGSSISDRSPSSSSSPELSLSSS